MKASLCFAVGALFMFFAIRGDEHHRLEVHLAAAERAYPSAYVVSGVLKIHSEDETQIVAELRIGNATDSRKKLLLVGKPDMAFTAFLHEYANEKVTLRIETADPTRKDGQ